MSAPCGRRFDEELLSGYLDGMLAQGERQLVEVHVAACPACREVLDQLSALRDAARGTGFTLPPDEQWRELPKSAPSRWLRLGGWGGLLLWAALVAVAGVVELARSAEPAWEKVALLAGAAGFALLLGSVLLDRLRELPTDRYRRVQK